MRHGEEIPSSTFLSEMTPVHLAHRACLANSQLLENQQ